VACPKPRPSAAGLDAAPAREAGVVLGDVTLEEVPSGSRRVVGIRARDMALAAALAATLKR
jgi:hypothetical protein